MRIPFCLNLVRRLSGFSKMEQPVTKKDNYVWIDMELTGLELEKHTILEVACIITTTDLEKVGEPIDIKINHPEEVFKSMNDWSRIQHAKSGLTFECKESHITLQEADKLLSEHIKKFANLGGTRYIAGNSVYMDKMFLEKYMPISNGLLHYRIIDVSCIRTLCLHWYSSECSKLPLKKNTHRALDDISDSIKELKELRKLIFK